MALGPAPCWPDGLKVTSGCSSGGCSSRAKGDSRTSVGGGAECGGFVQAATAHWKRFGSEEASGRGR